MLTLYRPGDGPWHRMPAGPKAVVLLLVVLGVCLLPASWWGAAVTAVVCVGCYAVRGAGMRELVRQLVVVRWMIVVIAAGQLVFAGPEDAVANVARVTAAVVISGLLTSTTPLGELLDVLERALRPLALLRIDPDRAALTVAVTVSTLPVLARIEREVREAQRARGGGRSLRLFAMPFLVVALKHADALGDALTARGVR
ncbi:energy-coupling factor transporter transmembrane component T family protein [Promicromonospora sp. NPDC059942]|uniref:energy-coupling factor transporter transmembrane component T family protein n=1 Tax=Promicromonospora sp. NPDC059942 TaxID=3347009 RepID=UPI003647F1F5